jgi:hypothetical protein
LALLALGLAVLAAAQLQIAGAFSLFGRHFWLDEIFTHTLVADADCGHALRALAGGVETHPPAYYLLLRAYGLVAGTDEVALRGFALSAMLVALLGLYATLRLAYAPFVAVAAVLAVWSHPLVLLQAFEARFYAPWLAVTAWFAFCVARAQAPHAGRLASAALALTAVLLCTIHYFGVIAFGLVVAAALLTSPLGARGCWRRLRPAWVGPLALACCLPLLPGQRAATTVATWVPPVDRDSLLAFATGVAPLRFLPLLAAAVVALWPTRRTSPPPWRGGPGLLLALGLMPLILTGFSLAVQPVLMERYAMPAVAAVAPLTALAGARLPRAVLAGICAVLLALGTWYLQAQAGAAVATDRRMEELAAVIRARTGDDPVAFQHTHELYPLCRYAPDLAGRCVCLDFEPGQVGETTTFRLFNRDLHRRYVAYYGRPGLIAWDDYRARPRRYLVPAFDKLDQADGSETLYPGFVVQHLAKELYQLR